MGSERYRELKGHFVSLGDAGAKAGPFSASADRQGPVLKTHNTTGERIDQIVQHPDYIELQKLSYGRNIIGIKYDPQFLKKHRSVRHLVGFGAAYYFAQTEMGLYCPICMTDGVGRVLEQSAPNHPMTAETIRHISSTDLGELWQGAMFLTEKQGGSDVGTNTTTARREGDRWYLSGDKWFCSNVAADAILALARMPDAPTGTRGLGLFLVLRKKPEGNSKTIRIHRIKEKLGVRSMPTGEVTFENTEAYLIGGINEGFKQMAEMLNLSRLYNAVTSVASLRRAVLEAHAYGSEREAFGKKLINLPLWRASMADLIAEHWGIFSLVFDSVRALDQADCGDSSARRYVRLAIPMAKALSGKLSLWGVSECMEAIGGNAYIEESILPRLLRDTQVLPIWEGTTHILTLDALRAIRKESAHEAFFERIEKALTAASKLSSQLGSEWDELKNKVRENQAGLKQILSASEDSQQRDAREWMESAGRILTQALLLEQAALQPAFEKIGLAAFRRIKVRPYGVMPVCQGKPSALQQTEDPLLQTCSIF